MRDNRKKIISLTAAAVLLASTFTLGSCGEKPWSLEQPLTYTASDAAATSNGGFAVEKGGYVYYINGSAAYDGNNTFGEVEKGALMRISTEDLKAGNYTEVETVVPLLFAAQNYSAGIYVYGDYVYFATPTTDKDLDGNVLSDSLDFKRAKLDGSDTMSTPYFRLDSNSAQYRFVEVDGVVYCLYVDGTSLKSFNTKTNVETTLVAGGTYYFDETDATNPTVYYTMGVTKRIDATAEGYNQLYRVSADATVTVDAGNASYTAKGKGYQKTYTFEKSVMEEKNTEAKEAGDDAKYDFADYTTYPYVNLGEIVLDGIGASSELTVTQYTDAADYEAALAAGTLTELKGYTYTVQSYQNGGVYFTRSKVMAGSNEIAALYYVSDAETAETWNTLGANAQLDASNVVSLNTTNASATALYAIEGGKHVYYYIAETTLYKAEAPVYAQGEYVESEPLKMSSEIVSGSTLMTFNGENIYYYDGSNYVYAIDYTGADDEYHPLAADRIEPVQVAAVEANTSWYKPEIFEGVLLYNNAQTVNGTAYNYISAVKLGAAAELEARLEKYESVTDYMNDLSDSDLQNLFRYAFRTGEKSLYEAVIDLYDDYEQKEFTAFYTRAISENKAATDYTEMFKDENGVYYDRESYFVNVLGGYTEEDAKAISEGFAATLKTETEETKEESGLPGWAIALIVVGGVLVVAGATAIVVWQVRKANKAKRDLAATAVRTKKKIDTTDDKSIDVYADETAEEAVETNEEEAAEETTEEVVESAVESAVEAETEAEEVSVEETVETEEKTEE
ncbi:MAG: hypothetical protein IJX81_05775 [Clostridia bacterium]|nr:hypothetical protein [Clostridia bacterium]